MHSISGFTSWILFLISFAVGLMILVMCCLALMTCFHCVKANQHVQEITSSMAPKSDIKLSMSNLNKDRSKGVLSLSADEPAGRRLPIETKV